MPLRHQHDGCQAQGKGVGGSDGMPVDQSRQMFQLCSYGPRDTRTPQGHPLGRLATSATQRRLPSSASGVPDIAKRAPAAIRFARQGVLWAAVNYRGAGAARPFAENATLKFMTKRSILVFASRAGLTPSPTCPTRQGGVPKGRCGQGRQLWGPRAGQSVSPPWINLGGFCYVRFQHPSRHTLVDSRRPS